VSPAPVPTPAGPVADAAAPRGWLGVRIQQVTDDIGESLNIKPARGALVAGVDEKGPSKPAGIEAGDVIIRFDGKDIKEMKELPGFVAGTPVGKEVEVVIIRKGKEEPRTVKLGRLEIDEKQAALPATKDTAPPPASKETAPPENTVVQKVLGLNLANITGELRQRYRIKDRVKGIVITGVDAQSPAADKRLNAGDVVVEIQQEPVADIDALQKKIDQFKQDGRQRALLTIANPEGEIRFIALGFTTADSTADSRNVPPPTLPPGSPFEEFFDEFFRKGLASKLGLSLAPARGGGVDVTAVDPKGTAKDQFHTGDIILDVNGTPVNSLADVNKALETARNAGRRSVLMRVQSSSGPRFIAVSIVDAPASAGGDQPPPRFEPPPPAHQPVTGRHPGGRGRR
jgi:S1-C subfamily serine protease